MQSRAEGASRWAATDDLLYASTVRATRQLRYGIVSERTHARHINHSCTNKVCNSVEKRDSREKILWYVCLSLLVEMHHVGEKGPGARDHGTTRHARDTVLAFAQAEIRESIAKKW